MRQEPEINWQPLSALPRVGKMIDDTLEGAQDQHQNLLDVRDRPHVLNDDIIEGVKQVYTTQRDHVSGYEQQLARWRKEQPNAAQQQEIERLGKQLVTLRETLDAILALAAELEQGTIEHAAQIAAHESPGATKLYDRRSDDITRDKIERIVLALQEKVGERALEPWRARTCKAK